MRTKANVMAMRIRLKEEVRQITDALHAVLTGNRAYGEYPILVMAHHSKLAEVAMLAWVLDETLPDPPPIPLP